MRVRELKQELRLWGERVSGTKSVLTERLLRARGKAEARAVLPVPLSLDAAAQMSVLELKRALWERGERETSGLKKQELRDCLLRRLEVELLLVEEETGAATQPSPQEYREPLSSTTTTTTPPEPLPSVVVMTHDKDLFQLVSEVMPRNTHTPLRTHPTLARQKRAHAP